MIGSLFVALPPTEAEDILIKAEYDMRDHVRQMHLERYAKGPYDSILAYCLVHNVKFITMKWMEGELER